MYVAKIIPDYLVFFDDVRVDHLVVSYQTSSSITGQINRASIDLAFRYGVHSDTDYVDVKAVTKMLRERVTAATSVFIFVKNVITELYEAVFVGNIEGCRVINDKRACIANLTFSCAGSMEWLNRIETVIAIPFSDFITNGGTPNSFRLKSQGIEVKDTLVAQSESDIKLNDMTITMMLDKIKSNAKTLNTIYRDKEGVTWFNAILDRIDIASDINKTLLQSSLVDFRLNTEALSVETIYVTISKFIGPLMFEFFETPKGRIKIKAPFWNDPVPKNHVIEDIFVISDPADYDYGAQVTRVTAVGGVSADLQVDGGSPADMMLKIPMVAYTEDGGVGKWASLSGSAGYDIGGAETSIMDSTASVTGDSGASETPIISGGGESRGPNPSYAEIHQLIYDLCTQKNIPPTLGYATAWTESSYTQFTNKGDPLISASQDYGIMQINKSAHPDAFPAVANDWRENVRTGINYLAARYETAKKKYRGVSDIARASYSAYNTGSNYSRWETGTDSRDQNFFKYYQTEPWQSKISGGGGATSYDAYSSNITMTTAPKTEVTISDLSGLWKKKYKEFETGVSWIDSNKASSTPKQATRIKTMKWNVPEMMVSHVGSAGKVTFVGPNKADDYNRMGNTVRVQLTEGPYRGFEIVYGGFTEYFVDVHETVDDGIKLGRIGKNPSKPSAVLAIEVRKPSYAKNYKNTKVEDITILPTVYFRDTVENKLTPTTGARVAVGIDSFLKSTAAERQIGLRPASISQPIIKTMPTNFGAATEALQKFTSFEFKRRNAYASTRTLSCIGMPWIEPGYNIWYDPAGEDMVYYVHSVSHHGSSGESYTTISCIYGRDAVDFFEGPESKFGTVRASGLNSDHVFVNQSNPIYAVQSIVESIGAEESKQIRRDSIAFAEMTMFGKETFLANEPYMQGLYGPGINIPVSGAALAGLNLHEPMQIDDLQGELSKLFSSGPTIVKTRREGIKSAIEKINTLGILY